MRVWYGFSVAVLTSYHAYHAYFHSNWIDYRETVSDNRGILKCKINLLPQQKFRQGDYQQNAITNLFIVCNCGSDLLYLTSTI